MKIFTLTCSPLKNEAPAAFNELMEAWEGQQVADSTWILKRNDGCTCQTIIDDLREHISAENDFSVVEIKTERRQTPTH